ncbi:hypothetical protein BD779DRAFT_1786899 [Infundibulicybe gibba]|nr:hypothetical protein BD779DRAFT_1786899 [Infundibulicybe gibba]
MKDIPSNIGGHAIWRGRSPRTREITIGIPIHSRYSDRRSCEEPGGNVGYQEVTLEHPRGFMGCPFLQPVSPYNPLVVHIALGDSANTLLVEMGTAFIVSLRVVRWGLGGHFNGDDEGGEGQGGMKRTVWWLKSDERNLHHSATAGATRARAPIVGHPLRVLTKQFSSASTTGGYPSHVGADE